MRWGVLLLGLVHCGSEPAREPPPEEPCALTEQLAAALDPAWQVVGGPGAVLAVDSPVSGPCIVATGLADIAGEVPMTIAHVFGIGSITKTFTAAVVLQLRDEGALSLADPLSLYYPNVSYAADVNLEQLLRHTSGIGDIVDSGALLSALDEVWTPADLVALTDVPLSEPAGTRWEYSNTNYILLGLVIEAASGNSWESEVRARLLEPLDLQHTWLPTVDAATADKLSLVARGYVGMTDTTEDIDPSIGFSAGSMLSSGADLLRWLDALLGGEVLSAASLAEMSAPTVTPLSGTTAYGLGLKLFDGGEQRGHDGDAIIYSSHAFRTSSASVVALLNAGPYKDMSALAAAGWSVLDAEAH